MKDQFLSSVCVRVCHILIDVKLCKNCAFGSQGVPLISMTLNDCSMINRVTQFNLKLQGDHPCTVSDGPTKRPQYMRISRLIIGTYLPIFQSVNSNVFHTATHVFCREWQPAKPRIGVLMFSVSPGTVVAICYLRGKGQLPILLQRDGGYT